MADDVSSLVSGPDRESVGSPAAADPALWNVTALFTGPRKCDRHGENITTQFTVGLQLVSVTDSPTK